MASDPRLSTSDTSLSADLIAQRGFTSSRRGFDPEEVRAFLGKVAQEFRALRQRQASLEEQLREAEYRAAHPAWDENAALSAVGEETASILRSAHTAAADIRGKAEDNAGRILRTAHEQSDAMRADAEAVLKQRTDEADAAAARVRELASTDAERMRDTARQQAEAIRAQVEAERKAVVEAAQTTRERILADLSRRRNVASVQIEQLRAGRDRLLDAYRVVRDTLDEVTDELQRADAEARAAALAAGRRTGAESAAGAGGLEEAEGSEGAEGAEGAEGPARGPGGADGTGDTVTAEPPAGAGTGEGSASREGVPPSPVGQATTPDHPGPVTPADESRAAVTAGPVERRPAPPGRPTPPSANGGEAVVEATAGRATVALAEAPDDRATEEGDSEVDRLFARIRADREGAVAHARAVLAEPGPPGGDSAAVTVEAEAEAETSATDQDELVRQRRDQAVESIEASLARRLKRVLQDEQNDLLDTLRNVRGRPTAAQVLPARDAQAERFAEAGRPLLDHAARAGASFVHASLSSQPVAGGDQLPGLDDLAADLAAAIIDPLCRRLEEVFADSVGDDQAELAEAIGAAYREWKTQRIELVAGDHVAGAFGRGAYAATPADAMLRWVVEDVDGPCPDCDDNALAGELTKGDAFPTGQHHPPAHAGCRCLLLPRPV
jgi:DivIVA domain-containing protein